MQDGLVQLVFILLVAFAAILDLLARNKEKRRKMDRMEREDESEEADTPWGETEPWEVGAPEEREGPEAGVPKGERRTADTMIPPDFWEEVLGGGPGTAAPKPPPQAPPSQERTGPGAEPERRPTSEQPRSPELSSPPPRRDRLPEGQRKEWEFSPPQHEAPVRRELDRAAEAPSGLQSLSEQELMDRAKAQERRARRDAAAQKPKRPAPPPGGADRFADLFRPGDAEALQRAIVYREVLGKPLAFRPNGFGGWEDETG